MGEHVYVITTLKDLRPYWDALVETFQNQKATKKVKVKGIRLAKDKQGYKLGLTLTGSKEDVEAFVANIVLGMMPARYIRSKGKPWTGVIKQVN